MTLLPTLPLMSLGEHIDAEPVSKAPSYAQVLVSH